MMADYLTPPIFISYSRKDSIFVDKLKAELHRFGIHTWLDRHDLRGAKEWEPQLMEALANCRVLFCVLSPDSMVSKWVVKEVLNVQAQRKPIMVLEWKKADVPDKLSFLSRIQYTPFTGKFDDGIKFFTARFAR